MATRTSLTRSATVCPADHIMQVAHARPTRRCCSTQTASTGCCGRGARGAAEWPAREASPHSSPSLAPTTQLLPAAAPAPRPAAAAAAAAPGCVAAWAGCWRIPAPPWQSRLGHRQQAPARLVPAAAPGPCRQEGDQTSLGFQSGWSAASALLLQQRAAAGLLVRPQAGLCPRSGAGWLYRSHHRDVSPAHLRMPTIA